MHKPHHRFHHPEFDGPFGPGPKLRGRGRGGRSRADRGDIRTAVLLILAEEPMHGYQLMQTIADRSEGRWTPSPGAIYPALSQLEDEGLVEVTADAGRKLAKLTEAGEAFVESGKQEWPDPFAQYSNEFSGPDLRPLLEQLHDAARQVGRNGTDTQRKKAAGILDEARRSLYLLLAEPMATEAPTPQEDA